MEEQTQVEQPTELTAAEPAKTPTPDELFAAFMQEHNLAPVVLVVTPLGGRVLADEFIEKRLRDEGWHIIVTARSQQ